MDRDDSSIVKEIDDAIHASQAGTIFGSGGLCDGFPLTPRPAEYFIAQEFSVSGTDLRQAISRALEDLGVTPVRADDFYSSGAMLCKISALIQTTPFGVYQLSRSQNRNVYLFILIKDKDALVPSILGTLEYVQIDSFLELEYELKKKVEENSTTIGRYVVPPPSEAKSQEKMAFIAHGGHESVDYCITVARELNKLHFLPIILNDSDGRIRKYLRSENIPHLLVGDKGSIKLDETIQAVRRATFGIYQVEKISQPDTFIALGLALASNKPIILTQKANELLPADLQGLYVSSFNSYDQLSSQLENELPLRLRQYHIVAPRQKP
jgi:hypothetical protein